MLSDLPAPTDPRVLVDFRTADDAGVYDWGNGEALVQTVDFFTPIVDDPYTFGQIAAANALSDVYAMGGRPVTALAIAGFPSSGLDASILRDIARGGFDVLRSASVALLGGHTVRDKEVKFGYAVTGVVEVARLLTNAGAQEGDVLLLTKPLGSGVITTAAKGSSVAVSTLQSAISHMTYLNADASRVLAQSGAAHACTDVTGFGFVGHLTELLSASRMHATVSAGGIPLMLGAEALALSHQSGGLRSNQKHFSPGVTFGLEVPATTQALLFDPQTSGGLLASIDRASETAVLAALQREGVDARVVGRVVAPAAESPRILVI